ncbi:MAG: hypothetical protein ABIR70_03030 [Bryobacteraceae bacterium]
MCEVLKDRLAFDGKIVTIRGHTTGTMEGSWLDSDACPGVVKDADYVWDTLISLESAGSAAKIHAIDFEEDFAAADRAERKYRNLTKRTPLYFWLRSRKSERCVEFIITGQFGTRREFTKMTYPNGSFLYLGFGHGGQAPAQLVVKSTDDVVVRTDCR